MSTADAAPDAELPVLTRGWVGGWKVARLRFDDATSPRRRVLLEACWSRTTFGVHDLARCYKVATHVPPEPRCRCGFYAWHERARAVDTLYGQATVVLRVALAGRVEVYEHGLRAARQRVDGVLVDARCGGCGRRNEVPATALSAVMRPDRAGDTPLRLAPSCPQHQVPERPTVTLAEVAGDLGVDVGWQRS